jgi:hypothetical protein
MKKIIVILALIMVACAPAMANVTVKYNKVGTNVAVCYEVSGPNNVRAFALDLSVSTGTITSVTCSNTSYYIYPGSVEIQGGSVSNYGSCVCNSADPGAQGGVGTSAVTVEMGSLYTGTNKPATSGTLLTFAISNTSATVTIAAEPVRGGVVMENPDEIPELSIGLAPVCTVPNIVGMTKAQAEAAIDANGFTLGTETGTFSDTTPINQVTAQTVTAGTEPGCGTAVGFSYVCRTVKCLSPRCVGDVGGDNWVRNSDIGQLVTLVSSYPSPTYRKNNLTCEYHPCADINADTWVRSSDIGLLVTKVSGFPSPTYRCACGTTNCPYTP